MKNLLTFDLENWYDSDFIKEKKGEDFVLEGLGKVISLLNKHKIKATFFVTGDVLEKYPKEIYSLSKKGHEIASHSYDHILLNKLSKEEIKKNIIKSKRLIKKVTGKYPLGFRAPSWSINKDNFWIYEFLHRSGFVYSSSLFPINMKHYGSNSFPTIPFKPIYNKDFIEIPPQPYEFLSFRLPFCGGLYFRIWPRELTKFFIRDINKNCRRVLIYIHPWEFCKDLPRIKMPMLGKMVSYFGTKNTESKLDYILSNFKFGSIEEVLKF